ncbi:A-kinase anchor protein 13-like, partial [Dromiciops gliroides]|uniref:A-kinase anchor protein 13-like n=1 Tax=Dromiciops gliroides TaxID=33562 RepID=UPI001CC7D370
MNDKVPEAFLAGGDPVPQGRTRRCLSAVEPSGQSQEEEEEEDGFQSVPLRRPKAHRVRNYISDPFRRHSWEPGSVFQDAADDPLGGRNLQKLDPRDPRRIPLVQSQEELEILLRLQDQSAQPQYLSLGRQLQPAGRKALRKTGKPIPSSD